MALSTNISRTVTRPDLALNRTLVVETGATVYEGALVAINASGEAEIPAGSTACVGVAKNYAEADDKVLVQYGQIERLPNSGTWTAADIGATVYATSDNVLTETPNSSVVGQIHSIYSTDYVDVLVTLKA